MTDAKPTIAIVDYGVGNLFSIAQACEHTGLKALITNDPHKMKAAQGVLLPGVGAFADAMAALKERDLIHPLKDIAESGKPLIGICLGLQLLMTQSHEFGTHKGLDLIKGDVVRLPEDQIKVPQVGWSKIRRPKDVSWKDSPFDDILDDTYMYFVHSFYVVPEDKSVVFSLSNYGDHAFCSSIMQGNIFACQFHPERSASHGLHIYSNIARMLTK